MYVSTSEPFVDVGFVFQWWRSWSIWDQTDVLLKYAMVWKLEHLHSSKANIGKILHQWTIFQSEYVKLQEGPCVFLHVFALQNNQTARVQIFRRRRLWPTMEILIIGAYVNIYIYMCMYIYIYVYIYMCVLYYIILNNIILYYIILWNII